MSDLNTLLEAFKAFVMTYISSALKEALEAFEGRLDRLEEEGPFDGRDVLNELDDLEREQTYHGARLGDLEKGATCYERLEARLSRLEDRLEDLDGPARAPLAERAPACVATRALWRECLITLEAHFKGVDNHASQAFTLIKRDLESMMKD